jgi:hypothetical protein
MRSYELIISVETSQIKGTKRSLRHTKKGESDNFMFFFPWASYIAGQEDNTTKQHSKSLAQSETVKRANGNSIYILSLPSLVCYYKLVRTQSNMFCFEKIPAVT